ncbi:MAG: class I SAM-dependent methyltransferase [Chloroflexi bacterium]|nr:class I SAM-dependent methyltransferase [Chloroflexota bacterium]
MMQTSLHNLRNLASLSAYFQVESDEANASSIRRDEFETVCRKLNLIKDDKLLDVGCELVTFAAENRGARVIGITVDMPLHLKLNHRIAAASLRGSVVKLMDYRNLVGVKFGKAVCLDPFATVGRKECEVLLGTIYNVLHPGGLFLVECITGMSSSTSTSAKPLERLTRRFDHILNHSSQNGFLPSDVVERIIRQIGFEIQQVEELNERYRLRLKQWLTCLRANQDDIMRDRGEACFHDWNSELSILLHRIEVSDVKCCQWLLSKPINSRQHVMIPDSQRCCGSRNPD